MTSSDAQYKLTYFDGCFWKGEVGRILLHIAEVPFIDNRLKNFDELVVMKNNGKAPLGQVPVLELLKEDAYLTQSTAIIKFTGKLADMYPADDFRAAKVDEILSVHEEMHSFVVASFTEKDEAKKLEMRKALIAPEGQVTKGFQRLTTLQLANQKRYNSQMMVGRNATVADLVTWSVMKYYCTKLDGMDAEYIWSFKELRAVHDIIDAMPAVQQWKLKYPQHYSA